MTKPNPPSPDDEEFKEKYKQIMKGIKKMLENQNPLYGGYWITAKEHDHQRTVMEALYVMLSGMDDGKDGKSAWSECEDCLDTWEKCNIHPLCKAFANSNTLDEFIAKMREVGDDT